MDLRILQEVCPSVILPDKLSSNPMTLSIEVNDIDVPVTIIGQTVHYLINGVWTRQCPETDTCHFTWCETCNVWMMWDMILESDLVHCSYCHRHWDGNAQCPCNLKH